MCDLCKKATEIGYPTEVLSVRYGEQIIFEGYVCSDCLEKIVNHLKELQKIEEKTEEK